MYLHHLFFTPTADSDADAHAHRGTLQWFAPGRVGSVVEFKCSNSAVASHFFLSNTHGTDNAQRGSAAAPCQSLSWTVHVANLYKVFNVLCKVFLYLFEQYMYCQGPPSQYVVATTPPLTRPILGTLKLIELFGPQPLLRQEIYQPASQVAARNSSAVRVQAADIHS